MEEVGGIVYEVGMEVQGLKAGASAVESELSKVDSAANSTNKNLDKLDNQASATGKAFSSLVSIVKSIDATLTKMSASSSQAGSAVQQTSQSAESANQVIAALNSQIALMQQQQMATAVATGRLETSINSVTAAIRDMGQQTTATNQQLTGVDRMIEQLGNQVAILDEQMENGARSAAIFAAQLRAGDGATEAQKAKIADLTGRLYDMKNGTDAAGKSTGSFRNVMQQGGYQIQDFIVQVQGGQSALVAFSQQGSQLAGAFGPGGAVVGALIALSTVVIGSLIAAFGSGKNAIDALNESIAATDKIISISSNGVAAYSDKFAQLAKANTQLATLMRQQAQLELQAALSKVSKEVTNASSDFISFGDTLVSSLNGGYASIKLFDGYMKTLNITTNDFSEAFAQAAAAGESGRGVMMGLVSTVGALASRFGMTDQQAFEFAKQLSDIAKNPTDEKLKSLISTLQEVGNGTSKGAQTAREYAQRLLDIASSSTDASMRLKALKEITDNLTSSQDKALDQARQTLFIEKQTGAARQQAMAWRDAENQGLKAGTSAFREYYQVRLATYKQQEANAESAKNERQANSAAESAAKKAANQQESISQKLENLRQKSELSAESTKELSREQAILVAQQSLGAAATQSQIDLAGQYAAKAWDNAAALKAQTEAEKKKKQAEDAYSGLRNQSSPITALDNNFQKDMSDLNAYATLYPQKIAEVEATRAAIEEQYRKQRMEAMWQEWAQQNAATEAAAAAFDAFGQSASNAITGIITGSMTASDALRSIGSTVLNSVINTFVQMGVEWVKAAITGAAAQNAATASVVAVQTAAVGTQVATSTAAAAATTAAWTPAAIMASIASMGTAAKIGLAAVAALSVAAIAGKRKNGGPVTGGGMYEVGEGNAPEIFQASTGRQYMIPGNSGKVISNKEISGGAGSVVIYNSVINNSSNASATSNARDNGDGTVTVQTIVSDISENGPIGQAIGRNYNVNRKATE